MQDKKIGIDEFTNFTMKGLLIDDQTVQAFKTVTDEYIISLQEAMDKGKTNDEAHKIATNILFAQLRSQN